MWKDGLSKCPVNDERVKVVDSGVSDISKDSDDEEGSNGEW